MKKLMSEWRLEAPLENRVYLSHLWFSAWHNADTKQNAIFFPIKVSDSAIFLVAKLQTSIFFDPSVVTKSNESPIREVSLKDFNYFLLFCFHCHHANKYFHLDRYFSVCYQAV